MFTLWKKERKKDLTRQSHTISNWTLQPIAESSRFCLDQDLCLRFHWQMILSLSIDKCSPCLHRYVNVPLYTSLSLTPASRLMLPTAFWRKTAQLTATAWGREVGGLCGLAEHPKKLMVLSPLGSICHCVCLLRACAKTMQRSVPECFPHKCFSHPIRWNDYFIALFYHTGLWRPLVTVAKSLRSE